MASERVPGKRSVVDAQLTQALGYRVDSPEGYLGVVWGVPEAGLPRRPLVLVVSDGQIVRFVSLSRVAAVLPFERRIVLGPPQVAPVSIGRVPPARKAA